MWRLSFVRLTLNLHFSLKPNTRIFDAIFSSRPLKPPPRIGFIDCYMSSNVDLRFILSLFQGFCLCDKSAVQMSRSQRTPVSILARSSIRFGPRDGRRSSSRCDASARMLANAKKEKERHKTQTGKHSLLRDVNWSRSEGATVTVSDASLLMYPDEIITRPFCS